MMRSSRFALIIVVASIYSKSVECADKMELEGLKKFVKPLKNSCLRKTGVDLQLVDEVRDRGVFANDQKLRCFFRCLFIMLKVMDKQTYETSYEMMEKQANILLVDDLGKRILKTTRQCVDEVDSTYESCTIAFELVKCMHALDSEVYFVP